MTMSASTASMAAPDDLRFDRLAMTRAYFFLDTTTYQAGYVDGRNVGLASGIAMTTTYDDDEESQQIATITQRVIVANAAAHARGLQDGLSILGASLDDDESSSSMAAAALAPTPSPTTTAVILSLTPPDGAILSPDPEVARFTHVVARIQCETDHVPYVFVQIGSLRWTIYDGTAAVLSPFFADHSSVVALGDNAYDVDILPNGGWWRSGIDIRFVSGIEMT